MISLYMYNNNTGLFYSFLFYSVIHCVVLGNAILCHHSLSSFNNHYILITIISFCWARKQGPSSNIVVTNSIQQFLLMGFSVNPVKKFATRNVIQLLI